MSSAPPSPHAGPCSTRISRSSPSSHPQEPNGQDNEGESKAASQDRQIARDQSIAKRPCKSRPRQPPLDAMDDTSRNYEGDESNEDNHRPVEDPLRTS